jgi:hypothetical protein
MIPALGLELISKPSCGTKKGRLRIGFEISSQGIRFNSYPQFFPDSLSKPVKQSETRPAAAFCTVTYRFVTKFE